MLDEQFLKRLDAMSLHMRHPSAGGAGGLRKSKALGTSVEFSDFREYTLGDDLRRLDWNAYARFDKLFMKLFMEEQEAHVHLIVDASGSMAFGEPTKWETAVKLAEVLSYLALIGSDTVTLVALKGEEALYTRPLTGRQGFVNASEFLQNLSPGGTTDLPGAIKKIPIPAKRGLCVFLSDFLSPTGYETALQSLLYGKQEVTALQILCAQELNPTLEDAVQLVDAETGKNMEIMANYDVLKTYRQTVQTFLGELRRYCHQNGMAYAAFEAEANVEQTMLRDLSRIGLLA